MKEENGEAKSAIDAIRCLYMARILRKDGQTEAAERWEARALGWTRANHAEPIDPPEDTEP